MKKFVFTVFAPILAVCLTLSTATTVMAIEASPVADANGPYTGDEGSPITLDGSGSYDPIGFIVLYEWDLDNDGQYDDAIGVTAIVIYDNGPGSYIVGLKVTDNFGQTDTDASQVDVSNASPTVGPITALPVLVGVGTPIDASAGFTDPGTADTHTAEWDWGDGTTPGTVTQGAGSGSVADSHTYTTAGIYTIELTVTDSDGGAGQSIFQYVEVNEPPPIEVGGDISRVDKVALLVPWIAVAAAMLVISGVTLAVRRRRIQN